MNSPIVFDVAEQLVQIGNASTYLYKSHQNTTDGFTVLFILSLFLVVYLFKRRQPKTLGKPRTTLRGEIVKSKGELVIADYLFRHSIEYEYEKPLALRFWFSRGSIVYPDFYLPEYGVYVEYWGLADFSDYEHDMKWKMAQYYSRKIPFISIYPRNLNNFDFIFRMKFKAATGLPFPVR